jgi:hypothetical protein
VLGVGRSNAEHPRLHLGRFGPWRTTVQGDSTGEFLSETPNAHWPLIL